MKMHLLLTLVPPEEPMKIRFLLALHGRFTNTPRANNSILIRS